MKKSKLVITLLTLAIFIVNVTACTNQNDSDTDITPTVATPSDSTIEPSAAPVEDNGGVYENEAVGIGIVFPIEYKDKYAVQENGNIEFTVTHKGTRRVLFKVERFFSLNPADGFSGNGLEDLLLQAGDSVYIMAQQPDDNSDTNNPGDNEYDQLVSSAVLDKVISGSYALESDTTIASSDGAPVYYAVSRMSIPDGGMQEDFVYTMPDGFVNPALDVPLLFINGSFTAKGTGLLPDGKLEPGKPYIPVELVVEAYGGTTAWNKSTQTMAIKIFDNEIEMTVNSTGAKLNGSEVTLLSAPILDNDCVYVAADDDFYRYFSLSTCYMPDFEFPPFAKNPIIAIDEISVQDYNSSVDVIEMKEYVQQQLIEGLENAKKGCMGTKYETEMLNVQQEILQKINNMTVYGAVSKYVMMDGPYQLLVDVYSKDIYFFIPGHGRSIVKEADINDPYLFIPNYVGDY